MWCSHFTFKAKSNLPRNAPASFSNLGVMYFLSIESNNSPAMKCMIRMAYVSLFDGPEAPSLSHNDFSTNITAALSLFGRQLAMVNPLLLRCLNTSGIPTTTSCVECNLLNIFRTNSFPFRVLEDEIPRK